MSQQISILLISPDLSLDTVLPICQEITSYVYLNKFKAESLNKTTFDY